MAGKVTESIYNGQGVIIPLADVQHIERRPLGLIVVTKHTTWNREADFWENNAWVDATEAPAFLAAWTRYRSELESDTLADLRPASVPPPSNQLRGVLDEIEAALDPQIDGLAGVDLPDDAEAAVNITMGLWRRLGRALAESK